MDALITTAEAAAMIGASPRTVARYAASGLLPPAKRLPGGGGPLLFFRSQVEVFAASRKAA